MATKTVSTRVAIVGKGGRCSGGNSAIEKAAYISRCMMYSEYDGQNHYPKYSEDLVHSEVMLPKNAPEEYANPETLWNSVEMFEKKNAKAQLARTYRIELPNEWSYELAIKAMQEYVKENFVDDGMCAQYAIHDSVNKKSGQRNLHCHIMLTMRPILEDGSWGDKQKKIYKLDENGNKIRTKNGNYKCTTKDVTGWSSKENARKWRKNLTDLINRINSEKGYDENFWEYRSFAERGIEQLPQIHLGEKASALERNGIQTERGEINRNIKRHNIYLGFVKGSYDSAVTNMEKVIADVKRELEKKSNEVLTFLHKQFSKRGRLFLPVSKGKYLSRISNRQAIQDIGYAISFIKRNHINTFEELNDMMDGLKSDYEKSISDEENAVEKIKKLSDIFYIYQFYQKDKKYHDRSKELRGREKEKFDNKYSTILEAYEVRRCGLINAADRVYGDGKITPKRWERDMEKAKTDKKNAIEKRPDVNEMALIEAIQYSYEIFQGNGEPCGRDERMQAISYEEPTRKKTRSDISL